MSAVPRGLSEFIAAWMAHATYPADLGGAAFLAEKLAEHGWVQDAAAVRRDVAEEIATVIEERRPHIPVSSDPMRFTRIVQRSTLNNAASIAREAGARDG